MISEELISEVLRLYPQYSNSDFCSGNIQIKQYSIHFEVNKSYMTQLNVYEFAHKCKKFAYDNGYILYSKPHKNNRGFCKILNNKKRMYSKFSDNEINAIMNCAQWILDNKDNQ